MADHTSWHSKGRVFLVVRLLAKRSGGAERLFCELANSLADEGYDVTCFSCDSGNAPPFYPLSPKVTRVNVWGKSARKGALYRATDSLATLYPKLKGSEIFDWMSKNFYFTRRLYTAFKDQKPDLVISFMPPANTPSLIAGHFARVRVIPTNHNVPAQDYESTVRWDQNPVDRFLRLKTLDFAWRVHVLFPSFAKWFPEHIQKKIVVVSNYVSSDFASVDINTPRNKEVVAVGRLAPVKNYLSLVEAWGLIADKVPDWQVKIYGAGPQRQELQDRIDALGLGGRVLLMGQESDIRSAYMKAEVLCHPALFEGFGLSVAEALACGLPVVAFSDCPGVNEFVFDGENGIMVDRARQHEALAEGLLRVLKDDELRARLRQQAPESVKKFSEQIFVQSWVQLIDAASREQERA